MATPAESISKRKRRFETALRTLVTIVFLVSAGAKLASVPKVVSELTGAGIPKGAILPIGLLELTCLGLYWIPHTSISGTFLLTGYLGGAIVTHIIARENFAPPLMIGVWMFVSSYLRNPELHRLIPFRVNRVKDEKGEPHWHSQPTRG